MSNRPEVCGHICEGLKEFQDAGGGCKPSFGDTALVWGCDDGNPVPLRFCPFCAESLKCFDCGEHPPHRENGCCYKRTCQGHADYCEGQSDD